MLATWGCTTFPKATLDLDFAGATSLDSRITFTRGSKAWYFNSSGVLTEAADNVARFDYNPSTLAARGLLIEESRINSIRNNTMQGAVAGTPGTMPTNWGSPGSTAGLTQQVVGTGTENGITYLDLKVSGTPSSSGVFDITIESATQIAASNGQTWTGSSYVKLAAGAVTNATFSILLLGRDSGGAFVAGQVGQTIFVPTNAALTTQRTVATFTMSSASVAYVQPRIRVDYTSGNAIDFTLRIGLPQLELGAFATSVIPTTTTALTRSADVASMTGTNFSSWFNAVEGTIYAELLRNTTPAASTFPQFVNIDAGSVDNRLALSTNSARNLRGQVAIAGVFTTIATANAYTEGAVSKLALGYQALNHAAVANGGTAATNTSVNLPSSLTTMRLGDQAGGGAAINGYLRRVSYYPSRLADSQLQALTA